ncbi:hypothetical protein, partial [Streptomyces daliensis]
MSQQVLGRGHTTSAEAFWYVLGCLAFGASYFAKVPVKKALSEYELVERTRSFLMALAGVGGSMLGMGRRVVWCGD